MNPVLHFGEQLLLPSWLLTISLTVSIALIWVYRRAQRRKVSISVALDLSMVMMVSALAGGRLLHVFYEQPGHYWNNPADVLRIWQGGFVFYGGLAGALIGAWIFLRRKKLTPWPWADLFAPVLGFTYALGRVGCFLNGCCYGRACEFPWAASFPNHADWGLTVIPRHPTQAYAAGLELWLVVVLLWLERSRLLKPGQLMAVWLAGHALNRLLMESLRDDPRGPMPLSFSISSWLSLGLLIGAILLGLNRANARRDLPEAKS